MGRITEGEPMTNEPWGTVCHTTDPREVKNAALVLGIECGITSTFYMHGRPDIYVVSCPKKHMDTLRKRLLVRYVETPKDFGARDSNGYPCEHE